MALIIKPKRGTSTPQATNSSLSSYLEDGEIAIDTSAQVLYIRDGSTVKSIGGGSSSYGDSNVDTHLNTSTAATNEVLSWNGSDYDWVAQSGGGSLTIQDEGSSLSTAGTTLNFVGSGVVASGTGATKTITINGYSNSDVDTHLNTSTAATNEVLSWNGSDYDWVAQTGGSSSTVYQYADAGMVEYEYTASANQTTFSGTDSNSATLSYTANSIMVFLNGVLQDDGVDYTATNGTSVVFGTALAANDEVRIIAVSSTATLHNPTKLDAITTVNSQAAYSLTLNSSAYTPSHVNALIVSVNGITQEPGDSFTVSGSTITFNPALVTGDVVDYIIDFGRKFHVPEWEGDFTIDSPTLHVDSTNNRVGVGTLTPSYLLDVNGQANVTTLSIGGTAITSTAAELNILDGVTATAAELNYVDGVTSNIQTQLNTKATVDDATALAIALG